MTELDIWLGDELVARTVSLDRGRKTAIEYTDAARYGYEAGKPLLSCSLPVGLGRSRPAATRAFLEGLLPEGRSLETMASKVRGVRLRDTAPERAQDVIMLLGEYGRECAGAVVVVPENQTYEPTAGRYEPLTVEALNALVNDLPVHPLGTDPDREVRMSLAGAQPKLLLALINGQWCQPMAGAASTHIVKPTTSWLDSAYNEALVMHLANAAGLTPVRSWVEAMGSTPAFVTERYDRTQADGRVLRFHQEDMCQALGLRPAEKYAIGRPSTRMSRLLRAFSDSPDTEIERLFAHVVFRAIVGDEDGHGKNFSLMLDRGSVTLAPIYDTLCTLAYPDLGGRMATPIGMQADLGRMDREALDDEARAMNIPASVAGQIVDELSDSIRTSINALGSGHTDGWDADRLVDIIISRADRLEAGQPLGSAPARSAGRSLDEQTLDRTAGTA